MYNKVSSIEREGYISAVNDAGRQLKNYLAEMIFSILQETGQDMYPYMEALFLPGMKKDGTSTYSVINRESLLEGASRSWKERWSKKLRNNSDIETVQLLFGERISEIPRGQALSYYHTLLRRYTDLPAVITIFEYTFRENRYFSAEVRNCLRENKTYDSMLSKMRLCRQTRNTKAHDNEANVESFDKRTTLKRLEDLTAVAECFREQAGTTETKDCREKLFACIRDWTERIECEPVPASELQTIAGFSMADFEMSKFIRDYDPGCETLYFTPKTEVERWIEATLSRRGMSSQGLAEKDAARNRKSSTLAYDAFRPIPDGTKFSSLQLYQGGHLTRSQLEELAEHTTMLADADFWMDKASSTFLARTAAPLLFSRGRKLVADWDTRIELFAAEKNLGGAYTEEQQKLAKRAHTVMSLAHDQNFLHYLPQETTMLSSEGRILKMIQTHPNCGFTVFTKNKNFCDLLAEKRLDNVIPVYLLPSGDCAVRASVMGLVAAFLEKASKEEGEPDNTLETSEAQSEAPDRFPSEQDAPLQTSNAPSEEDERKLDVFMAMMISRAFGPDGCVLDSGELLPISALPKQGETVTTSDGIQLLLTKELGRGGEGTVFGTNDPNVVVKLYHEDKLTANRRSKLAEMAINNPRIPELCWPISLVFNSNNEFCGYTMPNAEGYIEFGRSVLALNDSTFAAAEMPGWDRLSLVNLCIEICRVFELMHRKGILMGDVNPRNMMLIKDSPQRIKILFVDCDSYQFKGFPCPVGTPVFTSPKIYERMGNEPKFGGFLRTEEDESYSVASLLFHILMLNQSPFSGKGVTDIMEAIRGYNFAYRLSGDRENTGANTPDGFARMIWNNTPKNVKETFGQVFKHRRDVPIGTLKSELLSYQAVIRKGYYTRELKPERYWDRMDLPEDERFNVDFTCYNCGRSGLNMPKPRYANEEKYRLPHLCNNCRAASQTLRRLRVKVPCQCGREYETDGWNAYLIQKKFRRARCPKCAGER